jgi:predicted AAA+ superfamily ATPase
VNGKAPAGKPGDYRRPRAGLWYWRSRSGYEVDFILDGEIAIEVKAAALVHEKHTSGSSGPNRYSSEGRVCTPTTT